MPLIPAKTSLTRRRAFEAALQHLVQLGRVPVGLHVNPDPHPVYVLHSNAAATDAKLVSWRYFAADFWGSAVLGDVCATDPPKVTNLRYGDTGKRALKAKTNMENLPDLEAASFEPRILRVPAALAETFWLHSASANTSLIVPCKAVFGSPCLEGEAYPIHNFLTTLRPLFPSRLLIR